MPVLQWVNPGLRGAPAPRLATIRRLAQRCGVSDSALRTALSRACAAGSLHAEHGRYRLGPQSLEQAAAARSLLARQRGYTLAVVTEGEGANLARLRELFHSQGLRLVQRSVWIGALTVEDRLGEALRRNGLASAVTVFRTDEVDAETRTRLAAIWGLGERTSELSRFQAELITYLDEPGIDAGEGAWRCVESAPVWYRTAILGEPPFPIDLIGPDYPLAALNAAWADRLEAMTDPLNALWRLEG